MTDDRDRRIAQLEREVAMWVDHYENQQLLVDQLRIAYDRLEVVNRLYADESERMRTRIFPLPDQSHPSHRKVVVQR
jgi:hypothetical protein